MPRWLKRLLSVVLAPALFLALLEGVLALCGVSAPRYAGVGDAGRYWIPCNEEGHPAGFTRVLSRLYRRFPEPLPLFLEHKPPTGFRVFVLGESAVKGDPYEIGCFTDWLRLRLTAMLPDRAVEVVNAGNPAWQATDVRLLLQESLAYEPDLLVWMVGNNEFVPHNVLTLRAELTTPVRHALVGGLSRLRSVNWISRWLPTLRHDDRPLLDRQLGAEEPCFGPELPLLKQRFREATSGAVADARAAGVPIVLCTLPRNLRDWPPSVSYFSDELTQQPELRMRWDAAYARGLAALQSGGFRVALADFAAASAADTTPAKLHFARGRAFMGLGLVEPARVEFSQALAQDGRPMRAQDWVEQAVRDVAAATGAPLVDLDAGFDAASEGGVSGSDLLCDNCHPNLEGHELIATMILGVLEQQLGLPFDRSRDVTSETGRAQLGLTQYREHLGRRAEALNLVRLSLQYGVVNETWEQASASCEAVLAEDGDDGEVSGGLGLLEAIAGHGDRARELIEQAMASTAYVQTAYVFFWKTEPPYQAAFAAAGLDMAAVEASLTPEQREQVEKRMQQGAMR